MRAIDRKRRERLYRTEPRTQKVWYLQSNAPGEDYHRSVIYRSRDKGNVLRTLRRLVSVHGNPHAYFIAVYPIKCTDPRTRSH